MRLGIARGDRAIANVLGVIALMAPAHAQAAGKPDPGLLAWIDAPTEAGVEEGLRRAVHALTAETRPAFLSDLGLALREGRPRALGATARRRFVTTLEPVTDAVRERNGQLVEWFALKSAQYLTQANDVEGAEDLLRRVDEALPNEGHYAFSRHSLRIDCLIQMNRLGEADALCGRAEAVALLPVQRAGLLGQRGSANTQLGRLDRAERCLNEAMEIANRTAAATTAKERPEVLAIRAEIFLRLLDLTTAREDHAAVPGMLAAHLRRLEADGISLSATDRAMLAVHEAAAAYLSSQAAPDRIATTITVIDTTLALPGIGARSKHLLLLWRADLRTIAGDHAGAASDLAAIGDVADSRRRGLSAPIEAALARAQRADRTTLLRHEAALQKTLQDLIDAWTSVPADADGTGFLGLGSRLRVLGELITLTTMLHGAERALPFVLQVQCCTALSRARAVTPPDLVALRESLLPEGHGALIYVPAWNTSHVFAIDGQVVLHEMLPRAEVLRRSMRDMQVELMALDPEAASSTQLHRVRTASRRLADLLLPAAIRAHVATWHHVTISGASLLGAANFAALELSDGSLLGERMSVATFASLPLLAAMQRESQRAPRHDASMRLFATLHPSPAFAARHGVPRIERLQGPRWDELVAALPPDAELRVDSSATPAAFLASCVARRTDVSLLLAHGQHAVVDEAAALGFSADPAHEDGLLTAAHLAAVPQSDIVVLAACQASASENRIGDDDSATSLARACFRGGASSVVASDADVRASTFMAFASSFVRELSRGESVAEAARLARVEFAGGDRGRAYFAARISVSGWGAGHIVAPPPMTTSQTPRALFWAILAVVLTSGIAVRWWRLWAKESSSSGDAHC